MKKYIFTSLLLLVSVISFAQQASEIDSKFVRLPRYADLAAINTAITVPKPGMIVYNIQTKSNWYYNSSEWKDMTVSSVSIPTPLYLNSSSTTITGETNQADEAGVMGINTTNGVGSGVIGRATNTNPDETTVGVRGENMSTNAVGHGVYGSHNGTGVAGMFVGTNALETVGASKLGGNVAIQGTNILEFGGGIIGKQTDNGKIGYGTFGSPNELSIVGAGTDAGGLDRRIKMWANGGTYFTGGATFNGNVSIGNTNPTQKLDVSGKIKIADDANASVAGNIRYNTTTKDFEGYDGTIWKSFTKNSYNNWGVLSKVITEITPSDTIPKGFAVPQHIVSDNYMALTYKTNSTSPIITKFYKWDINTWVFMNQIAENLVSQTIGSTIFFSEMTDDWLLARNYAAGNVNIYKRNNNLWEYHSTITGSNPSGFGKYLDIDGNNIIISAPYNGVSSNGVVYYYKYNGTAWVLQQTISDPTPASNNEFGTGIKIKNDFFATGYKATSSVNSIRIYKISGASFVFNSSISQKIIDNIYYEGTNVRISAYNVDFVTAGGGIYKVNSSGIWELIPNTFNYYGNISGYGLGADPSNSYTLLYQSVNDQFTELSSINISASSTVFPQLTPNSLIIPTPSGYLIYKRSGL